MINLILLILLMHPIIAMDRGNVRLNRHSNTNHRPPIRRMPLTLLNNIQSYSDRPLENSVKLIKAVHPKIEPLDLEDDNPLALHDATRNQQAALSEWLRMPNNAPTKAFRLKRLIENPTVNFNLQRDLKSKIESESVLSSGYYPLDRLDPDHLTQLPLAITQAIQIGEYDLVYQLLSKGARPDWNTLKAALTTGNLDLCKRILTARDNIFGETDNDIPSYLVQYAIPSGNLELIKYLVEERGVPIDYEAIHIAAQNNNMEMIKYFIEDHYDQWDQNDLKRFIEDIEREADPNSDLARYLKRLTLMHLIDDLSIF